MSTIYGYCRISRKTQNIERQVRNILAEYPDAVIVREAYTGTKLDGRAQFEKVLRAVKAGDTIVFDSVSRMSRNAAEGVALYDNLMSEGVTLVFLKESYINTEVYKATKSQTIGSCGNEIADIYIAATNKVLQIVWHQQIEKAFEQAQKEVDDLHQRTKEGIQTARLEGKQIGAVEGKRLTTKKSVEAKAKIRKYCRDFDGTLTDDETIKLVGIARNSYYKYKRELREEVASA